MTQYLKYLRDPKLSEVVWKHYFGDSYTGHCFCCNNTIHKTCKSVQRDGKSYSLGHIRLFADYPEYDNISGAIPLCCECNFEHDRTFKLGTNVKADLDEYAFIKGYSSYEFINNMKKNSYKNETTEVFDDFYLHDFHQRFNTDEDKTDLEIITDWLFYITKTVRDNVKNDEIEKRRIKREKEITEKKLQEKKDEEALAIVRHFETTKLNNINEISSILYSLIEGFENKTISQIGVLNSPQYLLFENGEYKKLTELKKIRRKEIGKIVNEIIKYEKILQEKIFKDNHNVEVQLYFLHKYDTKELRNNFISRCKYHDTIIPFIPTKKELSNSTHEFLLANYIMETVVHTTKACSVDYLREVKKYEERISTII